VGDEVDLVVEAAHDAEERVVLEPAHVCLPQRLPGDLAHVAIGAQAALDLEELDGLLRERAEVAIDDQRVDAEVAVEPLLRGR